MDMALMNGLMVLSTLVTGGMIRLVDMVKKIMLMEMFMRVIGRMD